MLLKMDTGKAKHIILDFAFEDYPQALEKAEFWEEFGFEVLRKGKMNLLKKEFHNFQPQGMSGFWLLSESHLSFHSWPEFGKICLDIFCCGKEEHTLKAVDEIILRLEKVGGKLHDRKDIDRVLEGSL